MSSNKKRDMEASDDDDEYDEDYKDKGRLHDALIKYCNCEAIKLH
jgi:hypothetical protein